MPSVEFAEFAGRKVTFGLVMCQPRAGNTKAPQPARAARSMTKQIARKLHPGGGDVKHGILAHHPQSSILDSRELVRLDARAGTAQNSPMPAGSDAVSRVGKLYAATGNELLRGFTRPATLRSFTWGNEKFHLSPASGVPTRLSTPLCNCQK